MYCVDGKAIEQEDDECLGVARCHGFSSLNESEHPMKSIAVKGLPSSRFFEQQDARMFTKAKGR